MDSQASKIRVRQSVQVRQCSVAEVAAFLIISAGSLSISSGMSLHIHNDTFPAIQKSSDPSIFMIMSMLKTITYVCSECALKPLTKFLCDCPLAAVKGFVCNALFTALRLCCVRIEKEAVIDELETQVVFLLIK